MSPTKENNEGSLSNKATVADKDYQASKLLIDTQDNPTAYGKSYSNVATNSPLRDTDRLNPASDSQTTSNEDRKDFSPYSGSAKAPMVLRGVHGSNQDYKNSNLPSTQVSLQNVNLIQINSLAQPLQMKNSLGLLAECLTSHKPLEQNNLVSLEIPSAESVLETPNIVKKDLKEQKAYEKAFEDILRILQIQKPQISSKSSVRVFLSLCATIQFGCPKISNEFFFAARRARTQFLVFVCLRFAGFIVPIDRLQPLLASNDLDEMLYCLNLFMLLFERYVTRNVRVSPTSEFGAAKEKAICTRILLGIKKVKSLFLSSKPLNGLAFVENFKKEYGHLWEQMVKFRGQQSIFIRSVNEISRIAFLMIKQLFMIHVFSKEGHAQRRTIPPPVNIPQDLLLTTVQDSQSSAIFNLSQLQQLSPFLVFKLVRSVQVLQHIPISPGPQPTPTHNPEAFVPLSSKRKAREAASAASKRQQLMTFPQLQAVLRANLKNTEYYSPSLRKNMQSKPVAGLKSSIPSKAAIVGSKAAAPTKKPPPPLKTTWLEEKLKSMDTTVSRLNSKLDQILSVVQYYLEREGKL